MLNDHANLVEQIKGKKVLVVGDVMLDRYILGEISRISPEAPVPVVLVSGEKDYLGGAANVAANAAATGIEVSLIGLAGEDLYGKKLAELLKLHGIEGHIQSDQAARTVRKERVIVNSQQVTRIDYENSFSADLRRRATSIAIELVSNANALILSDYKKGCLDYCSEIILAARDRSIPIVVDPKGQDWERYKGATAITPNLSEFTGVVGSVESESELSEKAIKLIRDLSLEFLLITRSASGVTLVSKDGSREDVPALAKEVFDVTGAGDTVVAFLGSLLASSVPPIESVKIANRAASMSVAKRGTSVVSLDDVLKTTSGGASFEPKKRYMPSDIIALKELLEKNGERLVMTNGCFDVLHAGHVAMLQEARAMGDALIVAVNSDDSIKRLKGPNRPINGIEDRILVLEALSCVDGVVVYEDDTPEALYRLVPPHVLVKGSDYNIDEIVGSSFVISSGGDVVTIPLREGLSSSAILKRI